ncbi:MAG: polysaccharide biosynthesis C-terminal domain-containing protein [Luteibaculum sp.]
MKQFIPGVLRNKFVGNSGIYFLGAVFQKGLNFLLVPVYMRLISPAEYGVLDLCNTVIVLLCILFSMGLPNLWQGDFFRLDNAERERFFQKLVSTYLFVISPIALLIFLVLQVYQLEIFGAKASLWSAIIVCSTAYLTLFQTLFKNSLELGSKPLIFITNALVIGVLSSGVNILCVGILNFGYIGALCGTLLGLLITLIHAWYIFKRFKFSWKWLVDWAESKHLIGQALPFIAVPLAYWALISVDRWFILYFLAEDELGYYAVSGKFSAIFDPLIIAPVMSAYTPYVYKRFADGKYGQSLFKVTLLVILGFALASAFVFFAAGFVVTEEYREALNIIPIQILGYSFYLLTMIANCALVYFKQSKAALYNMLPVIAVNLILNFLLIPRYGIFGAATAFLFSQALWTTITFWRRARVIKNAVMGI